MSPADYIKNMKYFRKWSEGRNPFLAAMYFLIASFATEAYEMIRFQKNGKRLEGDISLPKVQIWIDLYKSPKRVGKVILSTLSDSNKESAKDNYLRTLNEAAVYMQKHPEKVKAAWEKMSTEEKKDAYEESMKACEELNKCIINDYLSKPNKQEKEHFRRNFIKPEFLFFLRVQAPCFMIYGTYPHILLNKAQNGDDDALEKLIRLDKSIIFESKISEIIHQAQVLKAQARMTMIKKSLISHPKTKANMKKIKCLLGGLISYYSVKLKQKVTAAEIRDLFDAISLDINDDIDKDLGNMVGEVFEKAVQRSRAFWSIILPDKK